MGLFSSVLHIHQRPQPDVISALSAELEETHRISKLSQININSSNYDHVISNEVEGKQGVFYLITHQHGAWITIVEMNVNIEDPFYLYELVNSLSKRLNTCALSFHLHDSDVLYYNLEKSGESLDGYNSDYQYFLTAAASKEEIISQRHAPGSFLPILPEGKTVDGLNEILNEGYWSAFDNNELNEDGVPDDFDKYYVEEEGRLEKLGKYLEIFSKDEYPFANWYSHITKLNLQECYLLKASK